MSDLASPAKRRAFPYLERALFWLEWVATGLLLVIVLIRPSSAPAGIPTWVLVLTFAGYTLLANMVQSRLSTRRAFARRYVLDLPVTALVYYLAGEPGGPLFILFVLGIDCAAASMSLRGTLIYTAVGATTVGAVDLFLSRGSPDPVDIRLLLTRIVILGLIGVGMAILARRLVLEHEESLSIRDAVERREELDRLRSDFISTISHDLRTPLTAMQAGLGMLEVGAASQLGSEERRLLSDARLNTGRLGRLVDDLLAYNELEAGTLYLDRQPVDLRTLIMDAVSSVHSLLLSREQALEIDLPEQLPVHGDPHRLEQVVMNLLANVYHHTPEGSRIIVTARVTDSEITVSVRDNGPGIRAKELEDIFKRSYRGAGTGVGSGLGLAIARGIVELHGGRIWAESEPGQGAVFHVSLPGAEIGEGQRP